MFQLFIPIAIKVIYFNLRVSFRVLAPIDGSWTPKLISSCSKNCLSHQTEKGALENPQPSDASKVLHYRGETHVSNQMWYQQGIRQIRKSDILSVRFSSDIGSVYLKRFSIQESIVVRKSRYNLLKTIEYSGQYNNVLDGLHSLSKDHCATFWTEIV